MEEEEALKFVKSLVSNMVQDTNLVSPASVDEILVIAGAFPDVLLKKFQDIAKNYDENFDHRELSKRQFAQRLDRILSLSERLPKTHIVPEVGEELVPTFTLAKKDKTRVLDLCHQMRKIVFASDVFDEPHKRRLLNRIAAIECQVSQPKGMFDIVRAGISDVGETLGKFGTDIKPLTDRMAEVVGIARKATKEYDQLPAPEEIRKLPKPDDIDTEA